LVGFSDGKLDAIELQTGRVVWQRSIAYANGSSDVERLVDIDADPIVRGDLVYLASYQGEVGALSMTSGQFLWHKPASTYKNMAMDGNTLYMTDSEDVIWAYDASNGQVRWKQEALKARGVTEPVVMGHTLLVGDKTGYLHVLDANHGTLLSRFQQNAPILVAPLVVGHRVYVLTTKQLTCYSLKG
ncbi:MAG: PQQ-binding-like beta-propeller repeat protein, partial [Legionellaceae bacterium]